jgi:mucolipin 3
MHPVEINGTLKYDTRQFLEVVNKSINFDRLIKVWLQFSLKTIHLKSLSKVNTPDCYQFDIVILFDNADHNGQMAVTLDSDEQVLTCNGVVTYSADDDQLGNVMVTVFDAIVMIISILSIVLCSRSILGAVDLMKVLSQIESLANPAVLFLLLSQHYDYQIQVTGPLKIMVIVN